VPKRVRREEGGSENQEADVKRWECHGRRKNQSLTGKNAGLAQEKLMGAKVWHRGKRKISNKTGGEKRESRKSIGPEDVDWQTNLPWGKRGC